jgi:hypothetical protein
MAVDFDKIKELDNLWRTQKPEAFDASPDGMWRDEINPDIYSMSKDVIDDVTYWKNHQRGIWLVTGGVGGGKSALIYSAAYKGKFYFGRKPILDTRPAEPFGYYHLFNQQTYIQMLEQMNGIIKGEIDAELKRTKGGEKGSKLLEQVKRYHDKRRPHNPMGLLLSDLYVIWRHLDILVLGATTDRDYLDLRVFKELTAEARCFSFGNGNCWAFIHKIKGVSTRGVVEVDSKPEFYPINVFSPREIIGGKSWSKIYNTTNLISMKVPKSMKRED